MNDLNQLTIFCTVIETGSMTEAANKLGIHQSGVSVAMQKLKKQLGTELFIRQKRGVQPTAHASALYKQISVNLWNITRSITGISDFDPVNSLRSFTITCPEPDKITLLKELPVSDNPGLKTLLYRQPDSSDELLQQILERKHDLFIDVTVPSHRSVLSKPLKKGRSCVVASKNHPRLRNGNITLEQFLSEPFIKLERTRNQQEGIQWITNAQLSDMNIAAYTNSMFESMTVVSQSDMISTLPVSMASCYKDSYNLQLFDLPFSSNSFFVYMLWHKASDDDVGHQWLRNRVAGIYSKDKQALSD